MTCSSIDISCHYWGIPREKFEAILDEIEALAGADARRYFETKALEPGHFSAFDLVVKMQDQHPRWCPPGLIALVAARHLDRLTDRRGLNVAEIIPADAGDESDEAAGTGDSGTALE